METHFNTHLEGNISDVKQHKTYIDYVVDATQFGLKNTIVGKA